MTLWDFSEFKRMPQMRYPARLRSISKPISC